MQSKPYLVVFVITFFFLFLGVYTTFNYIRKTNIDALFINPAISFYNYNINSMFWQVH